MTEINLNRLSRNRKDYIAAGRNSPQIPQPPFIAIWHNYKRGRGMIFAFCRQSARKPVSKRLKIAGFPDSCGFASLGKPPHLPKKGEKPSFDEGWQVYA